MDITRRATFYANKRRPTPRTFHIEVDGAIVNITVGLVDHLGHMITRVDTIPDGPQRGGDGYGYVWHEEGTRIIRLHDWERAPGIPKECRCPERAEECGEEGRPDLMTCGHCRRSWCYRCTPTPSARCPFELDHI